MAFMSRSQSVSLCSQGCQSFSFGESHDYDNDDGRSFVIIIYICEYIYIFIKLKYTISSYLVGGINQNFIHIKHITEGPDSRLY